MRRKLSFLGILLVIVVFNLMIIHKERALQSGRMIYLELAPVDPRSLMQGDYMRLRYKLARDLSFPEEGNHLVYLTLKQSNVATKVSQAQTPGSIPIFVSYYDGKAVFATDSYFFQEGSRSVYSKARYGELRVDSAGTAVLSGLADENLKPIKS